MDATHTITRYCKVDDRKAVHFASNNLTETPTWTCLCCGTVTPRTPRKASVAIHVYVQVLENSYEMTLVDTVDDLKKAVRMVENLKAQGFKAHATVEVK